MANVLVGLETKFEKELITLRKIFLSLAQKAKIKNISSVYELTEPYAYGLSAVVHLEFPEQSPTKILSTLSEILSGVKSEAFQWELLLIDDVVFRSPSLTLPYSLLHKSPKWVVPANDIWGSYNHPVLNEPIKGILNSFNEIQGISFYKQNKTLLDFLSNEN